MSQSCTRPDCFASDGEACAMGALDHSTCQHWSKTPTADKKKTNASTQPVARIPWSASALGGADLIHLLPRGRSLLIGVLGAQNTGKTTLLVGNYLQMLRGETLAEANFAGSQTLGAWESLAAWTRFNDANRPASFPPHTPRGTDRVPGLLHLALRAADNDFRDILLADSPGEWFTRWSIKADAPEAQGARWIVDNADAFLILADCEKLVGKSRGQARSDLRQLIERCGDHVGQRPTTLVWAKNDNIPPTGIVNAIKRALAEHIPHATEVETSVTKPQTLANALAEVINAAWHPPFAQPIIEPIIKQQPFSAFRGIHANT